MGLRHALQRMAVVLLALAALMWVCVRRIGLAPHDVALTVAVAGFAVSQRKRDQREGALLGESPGAAPRTVHWSEFVRDEYQLLGCVVKSRHRRSERILSLLVTSLVLLYWKAIFWRQRVDFGSTQNLRHSLEFLVSSKAVQFVIRRVIRFAAGRTATWQESAGWKETLQLQWMFFQYWVLGFMMLCVMLFLLEQWDWYRLLSGWCVNMAFAVVVMDLVFCYIRFCLLSTFLRVRSYFAPRKAGADDSR